jgi:glutamate/tyrosine decarboxylase-like PLP-dependent enzyme
VDGAYGAPAAGLPSASSDLRGLARADSLALDPHKWLYAPLEAGCTLVRDPASLTGAFSFHPDYYKFTEEESDPRINYYEYGLQNSRGFRALKVWLALRNVGREGYLGMIQDDIDLAAELYEVAEEHPELETGTRGLSITSFRYRPGDLDTALREAEEYLDVLNTELLARLQAGGEAFVSNVVLDGRFFLRCCIVNFRTTRDDVQALPDIVARLGRAVDAELRPAGLAS